VIAEKIKTITLEISTTIGKAEIKGKTLLIQSFLLFLIDFS
jgi:hypothetical protein